MPTLADLARGDMAVIAAIEGNDSLALRLREMGLFEGEQVQVVGRAPLGDPIEIAVRGTKLALRRVEALRVHLQVQTARAE